MKILQKTFNSQTLFNKQLPQLVLVTPVCSYDLTDIYTGIRFEDNRIIIDIESNRQTIEALRLIWDGYSSNVYFAIIYNNTTTIGKPIAFVTVLSIGNWLRAELALYSI
jgi:hypothetical protein